MKKQIADVRAFHAAMEQLAPERPTLSHFPFELRTKLIVEEALEFMQACGFALEVDTTIDAPDRTIPAPANLLLRNAKSRVSFVQVGAPDWPEMIDALIDIIYVVCGAFVSMGINDPTMFWDEVQRANLAKQGGPVREDGKRMKPEGWQPPNIGVLLARLLEMHNYAKPAEG